MRYLEEKTTVETCILSIYIRYTNKQPFTGVYSITRVERERNISVWQAVIWHMIWHIIREKSREYTVFDKLTVRFFFFKMHFLSLYRFLVVVYWFYL